MIICNNNELTIEGRTSDLLTEYTIITKSLVSTFAEKMGKEAEENVHFAHELAFKSKKELIDLAFEKIFGSMKDFADMLKQIVEAETEETK